MFFFHTIIRPLLKRALKPFALLGVWLLTSAFACPFFCTDQTNIQVGYLESRDACRAEAEQKISALTILNGENGDKGGQSKLVTLFSECMKSHGWDTGNVTAAAPAPAPVVAAGNNPAAGNAAPAGYTQAELERAADCAWARQNAATSQIAQTRAEACDLECRQRLNANPYGLRPAACAPEYPEDRVRKRMLGNFQAESKPAAGLAVAKARQKPAVKKKKKTAKKARPVAAPASNSAPTGCPELSPQEVLDRALSSKCPTAK